MKRILILILVIIISVSIFAVTASADSLSGTVTLSSGRLNVRAQPNLSAKIIGSLNNGSKVSIMTNVDGFYKISYNGSIGYVSTKYVVNSQATAAVGAARSSIGAKYLFGGATMSGFDCSGLTLYCYEKSGIKLPHRAAEQATMGYYVSRGNLKLGDLIFFDTNGGNNGINHVGIYVGSGKVIQAQSGLGKVAEISLSNSYWSAAYMTARRLAI